MKPLKYIKKIAPYFIIIIVLAFLSTATRSIFSAKPHLTDEREFQLLIFGGLLTLSYFLNRIAPKTIIPSFVWAILAGISLQPLLEPFIAGASGLSMGVELAAAIVLFAGGLEIPFENFKKWFIPIASLSLVGVAVSAVLFSLFLWFSASLFYEFNPLLLPSIVILGTALASTDPTAIIPTLKLLRFKRSFLKQIAISESALTDITGSVFTRFLLLALVSVPLTQTSTIFQLFAPLLKKSTYDALALQIISGMLIGYLGYAVIHKFYTNNQEGIRDPALLLSIPVITFAIGDALGGAGFLAAFISGLLSDVSGGLKATSHFYESFLDHLIKPLIFIILGALVPISILLDLAPLGILSAIVFMLIIRPIVVVISLLPWVFRRVFRLGDIVFLSLIRETGIIAAVLLIIASGSEMISSEFVIAIGMWIILLTLILEPPLTPYIAYLAGVAEKRTNSI